MAQQRFGSSHTREKLEVLEKYLQAYTTALKKQHFMLTYVDAFAGTGEIPQPPAGPLLEDVEELMPVIEGSAQRALRTSPPFDRYVFIERTRTKAKELYRWKSIYPKLSDRISIECADANDWIRRFCAETDWRKNRAVVFLDPFGNQVEWATLAALGQTKGIDLWYLFPAGLGVNRQIGNSGQVLSEHAGSLDRLFGQHDWRSAFLDERPALDLFGTSMRTAKQADVDRITRFMGHVSGDGVAVR